MSLKQRTKKQFSEGIAYINATFNNTVITISDPAGNVLLQTSAGTAGFKNTRKSTPYAAQLAGDQAAKMAKDKFGVQRVAARIKGPGPGRDSALRALKNGGLNVTRLEDITPLPHNGCRPRKKRRV